MKSFVSLVIEFYMFICVALLLFNIFYIFRSTRLQRRRVSREDRWLEEIRSQYDRLEDGACSEHRKKLEHKLRRIEHLMAYHNAVLLEKEAEPLRTQQYLDTYASSFQFLAANYQKRPAMERAFVAHVISIYHPGRDDRGGSQFVEILLTYFEDSTVFCRENVLQAFYAFGSASAVERAFHLMTQHGWYHNSRLLSDGLMNFAGDRIALCRQLWRKRGAWGDSVQVAIVQFAANLSGEFAGEFLEALRDPACRTETRFALIRYFQRHRYEPAYSTLVDFLKPEKAHEGGFAIAAASALASYPGEETRGILMNAMHSRNWYVRKNAASSLLTLGIGEDELDRLRASGDRYAVEMLEYVFEKEAEKASAASTQADRVVTSEVRA